MKSLSRVVWSEGMQLAQHHFQQQSRYFEDTTSFALSLLFSDPYGFAACAPDEEGLRDGRVGLAHARGVMPDGTAFSFPPEPPPEPLEIGDRFGPTDDRKTVVLALPPYRAGGANCSMNGSRPDETARFRPDERELPDETTGTDVRTVEVARKNFRLEVEGEAPEGWVTMPLAVVRRDGAGSFTFDAGFVPPSVRIGASSALVDLVRRLVEILESKARSVSGDSAGTAGAATGEYGAAELTSYWMLHTIRSAVPSLQHHLSQRSAHPERLFDEISRLAGALCTFSMDSHPDDLPDYDHDDLGGCFGALEQHVRSHLDVVLPTSAVEIPLEATRESFFEGELPDPRLTRGEWFLGVQADQDRGGLADAVPRLVKVCSAKHIVRLVRSAHPALPLTHLPSPPSSLAPRVGTEYFRIDKEGPCWQSIVDSGGVGLYLPGSLADAELELKIVPPSER